MVVGGGNSAGQAAVFLSSQVRKVYLVVRGDSLYKNMSSYLARRIEETPNIEVLLNTEVRRMHGESFLNTVEIVNKKTGKVQTILEPAALFSFIGALPRTEWLPAEIERDPKGFVQTGHGSAAQSRLAVAATVPAGDQPARGLRGGRRPLRLGQTRCLGGRRGCHGGSVRARIPEGDVTHWQARSKKSPLPVRQCPSYHT